MYNGKIEPLKISGAGKLSGGCPIVVVENVVRLPKTNRSKDNDPALFDYLEQHPIIDIKRIAADLGVSYNTISAVVIK